MLLSLKDIFAVEGAELTVDGQLDFSEIELDGLNPFASPVQVQAVVYNRAGVVHLDLHTVFTFCHPCDRCAKDLVLHPDYTFTHVLVQTRNSDDADDVFILVHNDELELDDLVREDILLELPTKYLCKPDCKGLCPQCGKNLNEGSCNCSTRQVDPRFEVLQQLID